MSGKYEYRELYSETIIWMYIRVARKIAIPGMGVGKIPLQRAKESLGDVEFEKMFVFWFYSSPDPAIVKNLFADFRKFY